MWSLGFRSRVVGEGELEEVVGKAKADGVVG